MAGSAVVLYHLSYEDPRIGTAHFFLIKPGFFAIVEMQLTLRRPHLHSKFLFSHFTSSSIMIMIIMMIVIITIIIITIIIIIMRKKMSVSS